MNHLLLSETFDNFLFVSGSITTYCTFQIDGFLQKDFFDGDELALLNEDQRHVLWKSIRPHAFNVIKGRRTPRGFKFIFSLSPDEVKRFLLDRGLSLSPKDVEGLFLNFHFDGKDLSCTTGTSLRVFSLDKTLDHVWDEEVRNFFRQHEIVIS